MRLYVLIIITIICLIVGALYFNAIYNSDLPMWVKWFLLR